MTLFQNKVFADVMAKAQRCKEGHVKMEAEMWTLSGNAKDGWQPPEARKRQANILIESLQGEGGSAYTWSLDSSFQDMKEQICVASHAGYGNLLQQALGNLDAQEKWDKCKQFCFSSTLPI